MASYYCPLVNGRGDFLTISNIRYPHLSQLGEIEEGYKVEYKSCWNDEFKKKHLCRTIASFANTEGGWIFVGINDNGDVEPIPKERTDFGQQIGEILKSKVSPYPAFETKFIPTSTDKGKGVLAIHVFEGHSPPYVCNGTVYLRVGSSKKPVLATNRIELDTLIAKREKHDEKLKEFCLNPFLDDEKFPYCTIYLYNRSWSTLIPVKHTDYISENAEFAEKYRYQRWMPSTNSTLFFNSTNIGLNSRTTVVEIFDNYSMKLSIPLMVMPTDISAALSKKVKERNSDIDIAGFTCIEGFLSHSIIHQTLNTALSILLDKRVDVGDFVIRIELKNIWNSFVFYRSTDGKWFDEMCDNCFRYSAKDETTSHDYRLMKLTPKKISSISEFYIASGIFQSFGWLGMLFWLVTNATGIFDL